MVNFANSLSLHARSEPEKPAIVACQSHVNFSQLDALTDRFANCLDALAVRSSDRVVIHARNTLEFVIAFFGTMKHGAIVAPVNKRLLGKDLDRLLDHTRPRVVVTEVADRDRFDRIGAEILDFGPDGSGRFWQKLTAELATRAARGAQSDQIANLLYTSGTTATPKAAIHTHRMRHAVAGAMANRFELSRRDVGLAVSPFFHTGGLSVLCNCMYVGATCVLMEKWDPHQLLSEITAHGVTFAHLVSTLVVDITDLPERAFADFAPRMRMTWSGGHSVDVARLAEYERRIGGVLVNGYSRTEGGLTYNFPDPSYRSFTHNGMPCLDSSEVAIYDEASDTFGAAGIPGEILVRGDGVSPGYWQEDGMCPPDIIANGWVRTGDAGFIDEAGALHFQGRIGHMIKSGGENVFPGEVEQAIIRHDEVINVVVVATHDQRFGEVVSALVVPRSSTLTEDVLRDFLRGNIAGYKIPRRIRFVEELPRLGSGKVDLSRARELLHTENEARK